MKANEIVEFLALMDGMFSQRKMAPTVKQEIDKLWAQVLAPLDKSTVMEALAEHAAHSEWSPNPYRLRKLAEDILCPPIHDSPEVAWGQAAQILYENQYGIPSTTKAGPLVYAAMRKVGLKSETAADRQAFMKTYSELVEEDDERRRRAASGRGDRPAEPSRKGRSVGT